MPASLSDLLNQRRTITADVLGLKIDITYRPGFLTQKKAAQIRAAAEADDNLDGNLQAIKTFLGFIERWDLLGDDGQPIPLTEDALAEVPLTALVHLTTAAAEDMAPGKRK